MQKLKKKALHILNAFFTAQTNCRYDDAKIFNNKTQLNF